MRHIVYSTVIICQMICNIFLFTKNKCLVNHDSIVQNNEKTTLVIIHHEPAITFTTVILDKFKDPYPYIWIYYLYETHIYLLFCKIKMALHPDLPERFVCLKIYEFIYDQNRNDDSQMWNVVMTMKKEIWSIFAILIYHWKETIYITMKGFL